MPRLDLAVCPVSWGIEQVDARNPGWEEVLGDAAQVGFDGVELGPLGYFPVEGDVFERALERHGLRLTAGYVMEPLSDPARRDRTLQVARATCELLERLGASVLVLIDDMSPERSATAGRVGAAARATDEQWRTLLRTAETVARIANEEHGLTVAFHPHAGTLVEFEDEIDRFFSVVDDRLVDVCIDTGHSAYAGVDPLELIARYGSRLRYLHLKDVDRAVLARAREEALTFEQAVEQGIFCPLGEGALDLGLLRDALDRAGYAGTAAVEQDRLPGQHKPTSPIDDARASFRALAAAGLASDDRPAAREVAGELGN